MGWLTPAVGNARQGLWGMNDAAAGRGVGPRSSPVAFFQVVLTGPAQDELLPVQPFLSCAGDVLARLGALRLEAIQILLPERAAGDGRIASPSGTEAAAALLDALNWFADCDPALRTRVRVTLDDGQDASIRAAAPGIARQVREIRQDVFACDSFSLTDHDHLVLGPTPLDGGRAGTDHHRVTLAGTLAEWSLDALGWLAALLADVSCRNGVCTPLMLTADRSTALRAARLLASN